MCTAKTYKKILDFLNSLKLKPKHMKTYMAHFRRNAYTQIAPDIIKKEQVRMEELMTKNIIQQVYMNKNMDNLWMIFKIDNEEILREVIQTLPMSKDLYFETSELMS